MSIKRWGTIAALSLLLATPAFSQYMTPLGVPAEDVVDLDWMGTTATEISGPWRTLADGARVYRFDLPPGTMLAITDIELLVYGSPFDFVDFEFRFMRDGHSSTVWRHLIPVDSRGQASFKDRLGTPILVQTSLDLHADRTFIPKRNSVISYFKARVRGYLIRK